MQPGDLKPCPFCGCDDVSLIGENREEDGQTMWRVWCPGCASTTEFSDWYYDPDGAEKTKQAWNRRPNSPPHVTTQSRETEA